VAAGPDIRQGAKVREARIVDVAPTVLYALGLPIPDDMDGRPLLDIFEPDYRATHPVRYAQAEQLTQTPEEPGYDEEDAAEMERRLRGLGYVS
jgi:arylsulfatase A-like enzyme